MRLNYIGGTSATGGTGALTLTATQGLALPALAFVADQAVEYSIVEYTDSTLGTVVRTESGFGEISAANVLTRTAPRTTWNGTTYTQAAATALSFGTANVQVYVSPIAEGGPTAFPRRIDLSANYGPNGYVIGANIINPTDLPALALQANRQYATPLKLEAGFPLTQIGVNVTVASAGSQINCAIAAINPATGYVGRILAVANGIDSATTGIKMVSIASRLFAPGWYWQIFTSGGTPNILGADQFSPGPIGAFSADFRISRGNHRARTMATYAVGADGMAGTSGSYAGLNNTAYPILLMR